MWEENMLRTTIEKLYVAEFNSDGQFRLVRWNPLSWILLALSFVVGAVLCLYEEVWPEIVVTVRDAIHGEWQP